MAAETGWIFGSFDPSVEYRSKPGDESVTQRRKVYTFVRYRLSFDQLPTASAEGTIVAANTLSADNGESTGPRSMTGTYNFLLIDVTLNNEGGQGSGMYRATETWVAFSNWYDWTTLESDLGISSPF